MTGKMYESNYSGAPSEALREIIRDLRDDPGLLYHRYSMIPCKYSWPYEVSRYSRPELIKKIKGEKIDLGKPNPKLFRYSVWEAFLGRRSIRSFRRDPITLEELSTLLYYSMGVRSYMWGYPMRMYPSAGALQPVEAYLFIENVEGLSRGIYHYEADEHILVKVREGSFRDYLYKHTLMQDHVRDAPLNIVLTILYPRTASKYGFRSYRYALLDTGHVGMAIYIISTALGLGTCAVGAYEDEAIDRVLPLDENEYSIIIYPVGRPR